ncbi:MAG: class II fructose-bisphosphate aldolase [Patescibacteria group bacterium]
MLVHIKNLVTQAQKNKYAVGAFNTCNLETTLGIVRAAVKKKSPVIVQVSEATIKYAGLQNIVAIIKSVSNTEGRSVPIALHLDHGKSFEMSVSCIKAGFSSVHIDASDLSFENNIKLTKRVAELARSKGVWVQAELGSLIGHEGLTKVVIPKDADSYMTDPTTVKEFIKRTGVNSLAVSVGAMHGSFKGKEKIQLPRLRKIHQQAPNMPLVLHGASGLSSRDILGAIKLGVRIINIDTDLRIAFTETLRATMKTMPKTFYDPRKVLAPSIETIQDVVEKHIAAFGSGK